MNKTVVLASGSDSRRLMLEKARVPFEVQVPRVDEEAIKSSLLAEEASARDVADQLAEAKARKISQKRPDAIVIGADQVLDHKGILFSKALSKIEANAQLHALSGDSHTLLSAAVIYEDGRPVWRHVGTARMTVRKLSDDFISEYIDRNWDDIRHCVGCYQIEAEGIQLFSAVAGSYNAILGLPLIELLGYLQLRGVMRT